MADRGLISSENSITLEFKT